MNESVSEVRIEEQGEYVRSVSASVSVDPTHNTTKANEEQ